MEEEAAPPPPKPRALALDALRGIAILTMCLSGVVPRDGVPPLPAWMFHAQMGPPTYRYLGAANAPAGFTWVDLVLPAFLFSMGCAFPLALRNKLNRGFPEWKAILGAFARFGILVFFAIYVQNMNIYFITFSPSNWIWLLSLAGFFALFPVLMRLPDHLDQRVQWGIRGGGVIVALWIMFAAVAMRLEGVPSENFFHASLSIFAHFKEILLSAIYKSDIIIMLLANCALFGTIIWIFTRNNIWLRLGIMAIVFAMWRTMGTQGNWINFVTTNKPFGIDMSWFYNFSYLKYLMLVLPGSVIGDLILDWMESRKKEMGTETVAAKGISTLSLQRPMIWGFSALCMAIVILFHIGYQARETVLISFGEEYKLTWLMFTPFALFAMMLSGWFMIRKGTSSSEIFLQKLYQWACFWLILGMAFEPLAGGIKKDPSDVTYYFCTAGLSIYMLISLSIWIDIFGHQFGFKYLILNGQNPMLAYFGIRNLLAPLVSLKFIPAGEVYVSLETFVKGLFVSGWGKASWAFFKTFLLGLAVAGFTRLKILWKS